MADPSVPLDNASRLVAWIEADRSVQQYLAEHLSVDQIRQYGEAGAWSPAQLVPLHAAGCSPQALVGFLALGVTIEQARIFSSRGWSAHAVAAVDLPLGATQEFVRAGVADPRIMRRLHRYRITGSSLIESARRSSPNQHDPEHAFAILATLAPLADAAFEIDSDGDPIRFVIEHGVLTCRDLDRLESERAWCVLGGGALSPALEFVDAWNRGSPADWRLIARALKAAHDDPVELRDRWLRTVLAAPFSEAEGPAPVPLRPFHNPCPGCLARAELRRLRDTVGAHAEDERRCA